MDELTSALLKHSTKVSKSLQVNSSSRQLSSSLHHRMAADTKIRLLSIKCFSYKSNFIVDAQSSSSDRQTWSYFSIQFCFHKLILLLLILMLCSKQQKFKRSHRGIFFSLYQADSLVLYTGLSTSFSSWKQ